MNPFRRVFHFLRYLLPPLYISSVCFSPTNLRQIAKCFLPTFQTTCGVFDKISSYATERLPPFDFKYNVKGDQSAEKVQEFTEVKEEEVKEEEKISNKTVSVEYDVNSDALNQAARDLITREFVPIAKQFSGARIMIEGNTDNTGSAALNKDLSYRRALSIKNFLVKEYKFDPNRFIVVGNGSQKAISAGSTGSDPRYRMTEFKLVAK